MYIPSPIAATPSPRRSRVFVVEREFVADYLKQKKIAGCGCHVSYECGCGCRYGCVAVCCSVLQCVAVCCSVLRCVAVCCSVLQCVAVAKSRMNDARLTCYVAV